MLTAHTTAITNALHDAIAKHNSDQAHISYRVFDDSVFVALICATNTTNVFTRGYAIVAVDNITIATVMNGRIIDGGHMPTKFLDITEIMNAAVHAAYDKSQQTMEPNRKLPAPVISNIIASYDTTIPNTTQSDIVRHDLDAATVATFN